MIKGVSKQVLEVTNPENPYFEKIVFFVKPQYAREDRAVHGARGPFSGCPRRSAAQSAPFHAREVALCPALSAQCLGRGGAVLFDLHTCVEG